MCKLYSSMAEDMKGDYSTFVMSHVDAQALQHERRHEKYCMAKSMAEDMKDEYITFHVFSRAVKLAHPMRNVRNLLVTTKRCSVVSMQMPTMTRDSYQQLK